MIASLLSILLFTGRTAEPQFQMEIESKLAFESLERLWDNTLQNVTFDARSLPQSSVEILKNAAGLASFPLQRVSDYSLLVRRTEVVDDPDFQPPDPGARRPAGDWTFPKLMTRMFGTLGQPDPSRIESFFHRLAEDSDPLNCRWIAASPSRKLNAIPLRLLAVVNRLDQGRLIDCGGGKVCGAEFRFVYAAMTYPKGQPTPDPTLKNAVDPYMTVSLEFVLPPLPRAEFAELARSWMALSLPSLNVNSFRDLVVRADPLTKPQAVTDLERVLETEFGLWARPDARVFRMRTNLRLGGHWGLRQYSIDPASGFKTAQLDQETNVDLKKCVTRDSALGIFIANNQSPILHATHNFSPAGDCSGVATCGATLKELDNTVLTLGGGIAPAVGLDKLRFSVSLDSCRGCHGMEPRGNHPSTPPEGGFGTFSQFDQIKYRELGHASELSPFLAGALTEPSFVPWPVKPPLVKSCKGAPSATGRNYDDILRRLLFHLAVLIVPPDRWDDTFARMQLTAFQTH